MGEWNKTNNMLIYLFSRITQITQMTETSQNLQDQKCDETERQYILDT